MENETRTIEAEQAIQRLAELQVELETRVAAIEHAIREMRATFDQLANQLHATTLEARERLAVVPRQRPTGLN